VPHELVAAFGLRTRKNSSTPSQLTTRSGITVRMRATMHDHDFSGCPGAVRTRRTQPECRRH
jgi:hypothetical protein